MLYVVVTGFALWLILGAHDPFGYKFFYLLFLPVVAAGVRHGIDGACVGLLITQFGLIGLLHWYGYDARQFAEFQVMMLILTMTGLLVGPQAAASLRHGGGRYCDTDSSAAICGTIVPCATATSVSCPWLIAQTSQRHTARWLAVATACARASNVAPWAGCT